MNNGMVSLVGAGPGDPGLITVKGLDRLRKADVVLFDRLIPESILSEARTDALLIDVGKIPGSVCNPQSRINDLIVEHGLRGKRVVRLKGGDPFVCGRGSDEVDVCRQRGLPCEIISGISSALAVPAAAGVPLMSRGIAQSFAVITAHAASGKLPDHDFAALTKIDTLVVLMGLANLGEVTTRLIAAGQDANTPVATVASGTTPQQRTVTGTLATIAEDVHAAALRSPVVTVIGEVARFAEAEDVSKSIEDLPLLGKRVIVTQAESTSSNLQRLLADRGANVLHCPLIGIEYPPPADSVAEAIATLRRGDFDLVAFTSVHGARAFWHAVESLGLDARVFARAHVAALGEGTAGELQKHGIKADLIPSIATAERFVEENDAYLADQRRAPRQPAPIKPRVLFPHGDLALPTLKRGLEERGYEIVDPIVYRTTAATPDEPTIEELNNGYDAVLFCSPSAVVGFEHLSIPVRSALVGCIGPTTAAAARERGLTVDIVPDKPGSLELVKALAGRFAHPETVP